MNALRGLLDAIENGGGWDGLDIDPKQLRESFEQQNEQVMAEARIVADAIATPEGRLFLEWLARRTIYAPPAPISGKEDAAVAGLRMARKEGGDRVFFMILEALQVAEGMPPGEDSKGE